MDIRSIDTTNLSSKRIEIEKSVPITEKLVGFTEDRLAAHSSAEAHGNTKRQKPQKVGDDEKKHSDYFSSSEDEQHESSNDETPPDEKPGAGCAENHTLDIKV